MPGDRTRARSSPPGSPGVRHVPHLLRSQCRAFIEMEAVVMRNCASDDGALFSVANWRSFRLHSPPLSPRAPRDVAIPPVEKLLAGFGTPPFLVGFPTSLSPHHPNRALPCFLLFSLPFFPRRASDLRRRDAIKRMIAWRATKEHLGGVIYGPVCICAIR